MKDQHKAVAELKETFAKTQEKYEATHDDLVKLIEYALSELKQPAPHTGELTAKGHEELKAKQAKHGEKPPPKSNK